MIDQRKLEQFEKANRTDVITTVLAYIDEKLKHSQIRDIDPLPYLLNCIEKLLKDDSEKDSNVWDIDKCPNPTPPLRKGVWRDICHEIDRRCRGGEVTNFHNPIEYNDDVIGTEDDCPFSSEDLKDVQCDEEWLEMKRIAEDTDEDAWFYLDAMETLLNENNKIPKRSQIAEYLGYSVEEVTNIQKRIKRRFDENHKNYKTRRIT